MQAYQKYKLLKRIENLKGIESFKVTQDMETLLNTLASENYIRGNYENYINDKNQIESFWIGIIEPKGKEWLKGFNLIKFTCKELGLTYKQLGEKIGYSEATLNKNASTGEISKSIEVAIDLFLETIELKKQLKQFELLKEIIKGISK